jgi:hypothetical protein
VKGVVRVKVRPAAGMGMTVYEALERAQDVYSWEELLELVGERFFFWMPTRDNVTIEWYGRDRRIGWDTHLVCVDGKAALFTDGSLEDMPVSNILPSKR